MLPGTSCWYPNWMIPPPSVLVGFRFTNTFQVDGSVPFFLVPSRPSSISYPAPDISVDFFFSGLGSISAKMKDDRNRPLLIGGPQVDDPPLDGVAVGTRTWRVSRDTEQSSPTLAARLQTVNILSLRGDRR